MIIKKITAIVSELKSEDIERALLEHDVNCFTVSEVKGRGSYYNNDKKQTLVSHIRIEIFSSEEHVFKISKLIMDIADIDAYSEGIISISPVEHLFWVYQQTLLNGQDFKYIDITTK